MGWLNIADLLFKNNLRLFFQVYIDILERNTISSRIVCSNFTENSNYIFFSGYCNLKSATLHDDKKKGQTVSE